MKVKDEIHLTLELDNAKASIQGQQVAKYKGKAIELDVKFRIREDLTPEQFEDILNDLDRHGREIDAGFEALLSFLERTLPVEVLGRMGQRMGQWAVTAAKNNTKTLNEGE